MIRFRVRYLQAVTALLYMGPLLAGLSGYGWAMLPPFVSIFVLWLIVLRPHQWPQTYAEWLSGRALGAAAGQILSQLVLVAVLFGLGRGIGGVLGFVPQVHPFLPVAMSMVALPLMRLSWDPDRALVEGVTIDELAHAAALPTAPLSDAAALHDQAVALLALPDATDPQQALTLLAEATEAGDGWSVAQALAEALAAAPASRHTGLRQAVIHWATDPAIFVTGAAPGGLRAAFAAAGQDAGLLALFAPRAVALARAVPERAEQFPEAAGIDALARSGGLPAEVERDLIALVGLLRGGPAATPAEPKRHARGPGKGRLQSA